MLLAYQFEITVKEKESIILGHLCYAASKLFNVGNYERKEYKSLGFERMPNWYDQKKRLKDNIWYKSLPSQTAQDVLARLDESWKSYLTLHYKWQKRKDNGCLKENDGEPNSPYYKKDGYHMNIKYLSNSFKVKDDNSIRLSTPRALRLFLKEKYQIEFSYYYIKLNRKFNKIKQVELSYLSNNRYKVYIIYEKPSLPLKKDNKHYVSIDIGTKNLLTVYDNKGTSFIVSGQSLLNTNYYFSRKIAYYQSKFDTCYPNRKKGETTKRIKGLYELKRKRINLILHRSTKMIVDYCINNGISKVIIGDLSGLLNANRMFVNNDEKHRYNQNIRVVCFDRIYQLLSYKLQLQGIELIKVSEAYTSSCLPTSKEVSERCSNKKYRVKRGLVRCHNHIYNADSLGAYNIMRVYKQISEKGFNVPSKGLSNPKREYIPVTDQFLNEDYINWNGKAGNVGISGRNYPKGYELVEIINQFITKMPGNSIAG